MILLDANVVSELMRPAPPPVAEAGLNGQPSAGMFIPAVTEAELRYGLTLLPDGRWQRRLVASVETVLVEDFAGCVLPFDSAAARTFAWIAVARRLTGRPISQGDA